MRTIWAFTGLLVLLSLPAQAASKAVLARTETGYTVTLSDDAGQPLPPDRLQTLHTKKLHLLVIDESMTDYRHVHPEATQAAGVYSFSFTPATAHDYALWADFAPKGGKEEYIRMALKGKEACAAPCVDETPSFFATAGALRARLSVEDGMGTLSLSDKEGKPVSDLEQVMGAYAHVVGFYADGKDVIHVHPMSEEPDSELMFHMEAPRAGTVKLFAQVRRKGKDIYFPFTVRLSP